jgi:NAD-dependent deacetylase
MSETLERVRAGESDPACSECGGILKSATVFFGQSLDPDCVQTAFDAAASCDLLVCLGTTLAVYPVAEMVPIALGRGTPVLILNAERTEFDDSALVIRGSLSELLPDILSDLSKS